MNSSSNATILEAMEYGPPPPVGQIRASVSGVERVEYSGETMLVSVTVELDRNILFLKQPDALVEVCGVLTSENSVGV
jgi:hypothetical protein